MNTKENKMRQLLSIAAIAALLTIGASANTSNIKLGMTTVTVTGTYNVGATSACVGKVKATNASDVQRLMTCADKHGNISSMGYRASALMVNADVMILSPFSVKRMTPFKARLNAKEITFSLEGSKKTTVTITGNWSSDDLDMLGKLATSGVAYNKFIKTACKASSKISTVKYRY